MNPKVELTAYLERERIKVNTTFPKYEKITAELFEQVYAFIDVDFEEFTDNRVYRCFLSSFKEIICFAFEKDVPKSYLRCFFKSLNNETVVGYLGSYAKSRARDIKNVMDRFLDFFIVSWQGYDNDKKRVLEDIIQSIDYWM
jgi:hypothetical protein